MTADIVRNAVDNLAGHMRVDRRIVVGVSDRRSGPGPARTVAQSFALGNPLARAEARPNLTSA